MMVLTLTIPVIAMIAMMAMELVERRLADHIGIERAVRSEHESVTLPAPWAVVHPSGVPSGP